jgi:hypothetical protein
MASCFVPDFGAGGNGGSTGADGAPGAGGGGASGGAAARLAMAALWVEAAAQREISPQHPSPVRLALAEWKNDDNTLRPHSRLGNLAPAIYAELSAPSRNGKERCARSGASASSRCINQIGRNEERILLTTGCVHGLASRRTSQWRERMGCRCDGYLK